MIADKPIYKILLVLVLSPVIAFALWCGLNIHQLVVQRANIKKDYSELNSIKHGLLSVDSWRDHITEIVTEQIDAFDLSNIQEDTLRASLNKVLNSVITKADEMVSKKQTKLDKKIKQFAIKQFVDVEKIREKVPEFSQTIIQELKKPGNKKRIKFLAKSKFEELATKTHDSLHDMSVMNQILFRYHAKNLTEFNLITSLQIQQLQDWSYYYSFAMIGCLVLFLLLWLILRNQTPLHSPFFVMSVLLGLIVLIIGLLAPMIEIDARIKELNFLLIGKPLVFTDQVIFYQSKSILDVVHILLTTGKADSIFVGALILIFSVVFPITKLICTKIYLLGGEKTRSNKFLSWFAFKSGKWSMADVMVVAIFMAYIGFKGILDTQMTKLSVQKNSLATIATNETSLQPGVILFVAYVMYGLILGVILKKITYQEKWIDISRLRFRRSGEAHVKTPPEKGD
jgi:hypothetical protein